MVGKDQVFPADVQIETGPQNFHAHRAALNVPPWTTFAPWAGPEDRAILGDASLPKSEICDGFLCVFIRADAFADAQFLEIQIQQLAVLPAGAAILLDTEIN